MKKTTTFDNNMHLGSTCRTFFNHDSCAFYFSLADFSPILCKSLFAVLKMLNLKRELKQWMLSAPCWSDWELLLLCVTEIFINAQRLVWLIDPCLCEPLLLRLVCIWLDANIYFHWKSAVPENFEFVFLMMYVKQCFVANTFP